MSSTSTIFQIYLKNLDLNMLVPSFYFTTVRSKIKNIFKIGVNRHFESNHKSERSTFRYLLQEQLIWPNFSIIF